MGVPAFYRWLVNRYPKIVKDASVHDSGGSSTSSSSTMEIDNFYLDMNGIIHPCFHPEDNLFPPTTYEDVFENMYEYIDNLFNIVRPQKLLYMAIDGVAPRAKMNQQRVRRFRTAKDKEVAEEFEDMLRNKFEREGKKVLPKEETELSDSNVITPGTEFMHLLSQKLQSYINARMTNDSRWKRIKVILSDSSVPGEGEHKIMSFVRAQRGHEGYDPNTRHCIYGLDADLIMLALATHEVHFSILREDVFAEGRQDSVSEIERTAEAFFQKSRPWFKQIDEKWTSDSTTEFGTQKRAPVKRKPFQFLDVCLLREYLEIDMNIAEAPEGLKVDLEPLIDDFIFMCFFCGNDFLPHMPTLEIHERAMDLLLHVYKKEFKNMGGYLVDTERIEDRKAAYIKLKRVEKFMLSVGEYEEEIFKKRADVRERKIRRILAACISEENEEHELTEASYGKQSLDVHQLSLSTQRLQFNHREETTADFSEVLNNTRELKQKLKEYLRNQNDTFRNRAIGNDKVKLGISGWRQRYYEEKFSTKGAQELESKRKEVMEKYTEGLCWVLKYYFSAVPSWNWFYPFYYAPFASDFKGLSQVRVKFKKCLPFKPFDQLMGVLPPQSAHALPAAFKELMLNESSSIIDFYPNDFAVDVDGKRFVWQAVCKLPFIQEERLLAVTNVLEKEVTDNERGRNVEGKDRLFVWGSSIVGLNTSDSNQAIKMSNLLIEGLNGSIQFESRGSTAVPSDCADTDENVLCVFFESPQDCAHLPCRLDGVDIPEKTITAEDMVEEELWHKSFSNQKYTRRPIQKVVASTPNVTVKGAGTGWGRGRGKLIEAPMNMVPTQSLRPDSWRGGNNFHPSGSSTAWIPTQGSGRGTHAQFHNTQSGRGNGAWIKSTNTSGSHGRLQNEPFSSPSIQQQSRGRGMREGAQQEFWSQNKWRQW